MRVCVCVYINMSSKDESKNQNCSSSWFLLALISIYPPSQRSTAVFLGRFGATATSKVCFFIPTVTPIAQETKKKKKETASHLSRPHKHHSDLVGVVRRHLVQNLHRPLDHLQRRRKQRQEERQVDR